MDGDPKARLRAIADNPIPTTAEEVLSVMGFINELIKSQRLIAAFDGDQVTQTKVMAMIPELRQLETLANAGFSLAAENKSPEVMQLASKCASVIDQLRELIGESKAIGLDGDFKTRLGTILDTTE